MRSSTNLILNFDFESHEITKFYNQDLILRAYRKLIDISTISLVGFAFDVSFTTFLFNFNIRSFEIVVKTCDHREIAQIVDFIDIHDAVNAVAFVNINENDNFANIHNVVDDYDIANFARAFCSAWNFDVRIIAIYRNFMFCWIIDLKLQNR